MEAQGEMLKKTGWQRGAAVLLGAGILLDLAVRGSGWFLIHVSEFYMTALGGAVFLLQIVSMLLSAWISGSPKETYYGFSFPELLLFKESPWNFRKYGKEAAGFLAAAVFLLALNEAVSTANAMTALAAASFFLNFRRVRELLELAESPEACRALVESRCRRKGASGQRALPEAEKLLWGLKEAVHDGKDRESRKICESLGELRAGGYPEIRGQLGACFCEMAKTFGFQRTAENLQKLFGVPLGGKEDGAEFYLLTAERMAAEGEVPERTGFFQEILNAARRLEREKNFPGFQKCGKLAWTFLYTLHAAGKNSDESDGKVLALCIPVWVEFSLETEGQGESLWLEKFLKFFILENEDQQERDRNFRVFAEGFFTAQVSEEKRADFLSLLFEAFYDRVIREEGLSETYRSGLRQTFSQKLFWEAAEEIRMRDLLERNLEGILRAAGFRATAAGSQGEELAYKPACEKVRASSWDRSLHAEFLLILYLVYFECAEPGSLFRKYLKLESLDRKDREEILEELKEKFVSSEGILKKEILERCSQAGELLAGRREISPNAQKAVFRQILREQGERLPEKPGSFAQLNEKLWEELERKEKEAWDLDCIPTGVKESWFSRVISRKEQEDLGEEAGRLAEAVREAFYREKRKAPDLKFFARVLERKTEELTEEEIHTQTEKERSRSGFYYIDGIFTSREQAEKLVRERYCRIAYKLRLEFETSPDGHKK